MTDVTCGADAAIGSICCPHFLTYEWSKIPAVSVLPLNLEGDIDVLCPVNHSAYICVERAFA